VCQRSTHRPAMAEQEKRRLYAAVPWPKFAQIMRELQSGTPGEELLECNRIFFESPTDAVAELYSQARRDLHASMTSAEAEKHAIFTPSVS
jgi:hypothetical protein